MAELVAKTYANALFEFAFEAKKDDAINKELHFVLDCLKDEQKLEEILISPLIDRNEKKEILSTIFKDSVSQEVLNFLYIIVDKQREKYIISIIKEYTILADKAKNKIEAIAITAVPLDKETLLKLQESLSKSLGKDIYLENNIDPKIVGGVLVKVGDKVMDGTIKSRLEEAQRQMSQILV